MGGLPFANGIADRIERDDAMMAQINQHDDNQVMHGLFSKRMGD
jgi:type I restriction enzyme R subunit